MIRKNAKRAVSRITEEIVIRFLQQRAKRLAGRGYPRVIFAHDYIGSIINVRGFYESEYLDALVPLLERFATDGIVLDVGANIGNHVLFFRRYCQELHAFEPNPVCNRLLKLNTVHDDNVHVYEFGLSDEFRELSVTAPPENIGRTSIRGSPESAGPRFTLKLRPFDTIASLAEKPVAAVKIDVEGHELQVMRGMSQTLSHHHPLVFFELNSQSRTAKGEVPDCLHYLRKLGYDSFQALVPSDSYVSERVPVFLRWPLRAIERIVRGDAREVTFRPVAGIEARNYPMIVAAVRAKHGIPGDL